MKLGRFIGLGVAFLTAACSREVPPPAAMPAADVLATVGNETITLAQFQTAMTARRVPDDPEAKRALLDEMLQYRARVQEARRRGYDKDPAIVAAFENMLAAKVREAEQASVTPVSVGEVKDWYKANQAEFTIPAKIRAAMIFVEAPTNFTEEKRAERRAILESTREKLLAENSPATFKTLAAQVSFDQETKFRGGDLGYLMEGSEAEGVEKTVLDAAFQLRDPGDVSEIVSTPRGYYLLRLTERIAGGAQPFEQVAPRIRTQLVREQERKVAEQTKETLFRSYPVSIQEDRLKDVKPADPAEQRPESLAPPALPSP